MEIKMKTPKKQIIVLIAFNIIVLFGILLFTVAWNSPTRKMAKEKNNLQLIIEEQNVVIKTIKNQLNDIAKEKAIKKQNDKLCLENSMKHLNNKIDPDTQNIIIKSVIEESNKHNLPPLLVLCLIDQESSFNPLAHNSLNATGLMQIIPKYHMNRLKKYNIKKYELFHIKNNIKIGTEILKEYFDKNGNNTVKALQKYVGEVTKGKASNYVRNIINNYISLEIMFSMKNKTVKKESTR